MEHTLGNSSLPINAVKLTAFKTPGTLEMDDTPIPMFKRSVACPFSKTNSCYDCTNFVLTNFEQTDIGLSFPRVICTDLDMTKLQVSRPVKVDRKLRRAMPWLTSSFSVFVNWRDISIGTIPLNEQEAELFDSNKPSFMEGVKSKLTYLIHEGVIYLDFSSI